MKIASFLCRIIRVLSSVACLAARYFSHYLINATIFEKNIYISHKVYVLIFSTFSFFFLFLRRIQLAVITYRQVIMQSTRYSCQILMKGEFSWDFQKILKYQISWKSVQQEPRYSMRTDTTKLIVAFRNFVNTPIKRLPVTAWNLIWLHSVCSLSVQWTAFPAHLCVSCVHDKDLNERNKVYTTALRGPTVRLTFKNRASYI
jgi:hypothetical protein